MTTKRNNTTHNEVVVERVLTSDAFLTREIKKAPMKTTGDSLIADLTHLPNDLKITIQGAREHNLKNVDLEFPRNRMVVFTGLSGSGKSSLAFDTLFAEGQRRYVESLSAYARQFLGQMDKPDVDFIEGLSPAVSIDQKTTNRNPRSTVGTITEIYDYLRLLFARTGIPHCPECGALVSAQTPQQMVDTLLKYPERTRFQILAPVVRGRKGEFEDLLELLRGDGYARALIDGEMRQLSDDIKLAKQKKHTIEVVVDRLVVKDGIRQRLTDSIETALKLSKGVAVADFVDLDEKDPDRRKPFSEKRACPNGHQLELDEIEPRTFSFNAPYGACPECTGIGYKLEIDPELVIPDPDKTLNENAIEPWGMTKGTGEYYRHVLEGLGDEMGFDLDTPWKDLPKDARDAIMYGRDFKVQVSYRNRWGRMREYSTGFEGVVRTLMRRHDETDSDQMKQYYESYMREVPCQACHGRRLRPEVLTVTVGDESIADVCDMSAERSLAWINGLELEGSAAQIAGEVVKEIRARLGFLNDVGLNYLTLSRAAKTLSGGEAQRIRLATQIGSGLVGVMYVLDEPSIGLHQRDNERLIGTLHHLRDLGNTLIVVEHDEDTIRNADWVIDIGPGAGEHGGEVVYSGPARKITEAPRSITGDYIAGRRKIEVPAARRKTHKTKQLRVVGARENNLKNLNVNFPLGVFTCVTGVSGSGKSTLVNQILYPVLADKLNGARIVPGKHTRVEGVDQCDKVDPRRPESDRPHSAFQSRHLYGSMGQNPHAVRQDARSAGARLWSRTVLVQRQGRPLRGMPRRRHVENRNELPAGRVRGLRGMPRPALQPRDSRSEVQRQIGRRRAEHAHRGGRAVLQGVPVHLALPGHPGAGRSRLYPARPAGADAVRRRIAARETRDGTPTAFHRQNRVHPRRADHRPAFRGRTQTAARIAGIGGQGQHRHRHRAQSRRGQIRGLDHRSGAGRR